ncbi:integral membrane sensor signal transduction histidine kinase [Caldicellulosiruptor obsidiansis OB47]|uniref:histidine kinase n=1 Tax=Caldicellulosiruptor obsidiansis (strain ATCC BAA-2073 / JCM 16842 / OB47) TaxID=608506 RepID=D9THY4_CALOO|nr:ATP-binding protein [Caldicellulosiruptor obsidiansis]ADL41616.1 integral membrane sensor signal transduction histidine kinase [Caldicellulosiruptor obsidiansis OB47]
MKKNFLKCLNIRLKLTIWYSIMLMVIVALFSLFLYLLMFQTLEISERSFLQDFAYEVALRINISKDSKITISESHRIISSGAQIVVYSKNKKMIYSTSNLFAKSIKNIPLDTKVRMFELNGKEWLVYDQRIYDMKNNLIGWLRIGRPSSTRRIMNNLKNVIFLSIPIPFLIAVAGGYILAKKALKPIDDITTMARTIGHTDLSKRLNFPNTNDEIGRLALTFDEMLERLENAFKRERRFLSDASHELRTPLATIKALVEEALERNLTKDRYHQQLHYIYREILKMNKIISQLFMLSRCEEGNWPVDFEKINLKNMVEDVIEEMKEFALQKEVKLYHDCNKEIFIEGDQTLLTRLFINLIENAIKYNKKGGWVKTKVEELEHQIKITIEDSGIGIPEEDLPFIFNRFYRVDKARTTEGIGLGLSIVDWIVKIHKGRINVTSKIGIGSCFEIILPKEQKSTT